MRGSQRGARGVEPCHPVVTGHTYLLFPECVKNKKEVLCLYTETSMKT